MVSELLLYLNIFPANEVCSARPTSIICCS